MILRVYYSKSSWFSKFIDYISKITSNIKQVQQKFQEAKQKLVFPTCIIYFKQSIQASAYFIYVEIPFLLIYLFSML